MRRFQVFAEKEGSTRVVWIADFLPDEVASTQNTMESAMQIKKATLDQIVE
jgi:hypothetical protein